MSLEEFFLVFFYFGQLLSLFAWWDIGIAEEYRPIYFIEYLSNGFWSFEHLNKEQESGSREGGGSPLTSISPSETWASAQGSSPGILRSKLWKLLRMWGTLDCGEVTVTLYLCPFRRKCKRVHQSRVTRSWKMLVTLRGGAEDGDPQSHKGLA